VRLIFLQISGPQIFGAGGRGFASIMIVDGLWALRAGGPHPQDERRHE
jgi:hypothetical protein